LVRELLAHAPEQLIRALSNIVHPVAADTIRVFVDLLLERLDYGGDGAPVVSSIARGAGLSTRVVRRACRAVGLPTPERLVEWVTLIYAIALAQWESVSIARAAARIGVTDKYVRGLRALLLPDIPRLDAAVARDALSLAMIRFAEVCGLGSEQAVAASEQLMA
jgi:AraC-like DNA-binding protein